MGTVECSDYACLNALSDESLCDCSGCYGAGHGSAHRATRQAARDAIRARYVEPGFTQAMLDAASDEEPF
jgi:hypothetical protein